MTDQNSKKDYSLPVSILISTLILASAWIYTAGLKFQQSQSQTRVQSQTKPTEGVVLPIQWGDLGAKMVSVGVIDRDKFEQLYASRGGLNVEAKNLLDGESKGNLKITPENSVALLNLLWALGLGTKNDILETGPMADPRYGGVGNFASTGGWALAKGDPSMNSGQAAMNHYSRHQFIVLTPEQQKIVERVSKNIYRPCCDNSTHFPDCNHGMAMLGLLELMASQGAVETEIYRTALIMNSFWFPEQYNTIVRYFESKGYSSQNIDPKEILGPVYSSVSGFGRIAAFVPPETDKRNDGSCEA